MPLPLLRDPAQQLVVLDRLAHAQVELWFDELTTKKLERSAHQSVRALNADIRAWIENWNQDPRPYVWTKPAERILDSIARYCQRINQTAH